MADGALSTAVGDALIGLLEWGKPLLRPGVTRFASRVAEAVRPDPPISLRTLDGHVLTGIAVMDRGQVIAFLGSRHPAPSATTPNPVIRRDYIGDEASWPHSSAAYPR